MSDNKDKLKTKKTLSLKLGSKPLIAPKKNIESGKTVIVEKKRYKRSSQSDNQIKKHSLGQEKVSENKKEFSQKTFLRYFTHNIHWTLLLQ